MLAEYMQACFNLNMLFNGESFRKLFKLCLMAPFCRQTIYLLRVYVCSKASHLNPDAVDPSEIIVTIGDLPCDVDSVKDRRTIRCKVPEKRGGNARVAVERFRYSRF